MQNTKHTYLIATLLLVVSLAACAPSYPVKYKNPQLVAEPEKVDAQLAQAATRASNALERLAAIEQTRTPSASVAPAENVPLELRRAITVNWIGPVENIAKTVSERASYRFKVIGQKPATDLVVSLNEENKPIIDVLRSIGLQLGTRADVSVNAVTQTVELRYSSVIETIEPNF